MRVCVCSPILSCKATQGHECRTVIEERKRSVVTLSTWRFVHGGHTNVPFPHLRNNGAQSVLYTFASVSTPDVQCNHLRVGEHSRDEHEMRSCLYQWCAYEVCCVVLLLEHRGEARHAPWHRRPEFRSFRIVCGRVQIHHVDADGMTTSLNGGS